ncbi:hypothetical protein F4806DRAFT_402223 [Annulohypoxylon nitens]|nr:hypothetical protein F4806DRAFT_402223 [Annulohypoxylon nitens]
MLEISGALYEDRIGRYSVRVLRGIALVATRLWDRSACTRADRRLVFSEYLAGPCPWTAAPGGFRAFPSFLFAALRIFGITAPSVAAAGAGAGVSPISGICLFLGFWGLMDTCRGFQESRRADSVLALGTARLLNRSFWQEGPLGLHKCEG